MHIIKKTLGAGSGWSGVAWGVGGGMLNPLTPMSDQCINSLYNFNTLSSRQAMRIKKTIN